VKHTSAIGVGVGGGTGVGGAGVGDDSHSSLTASVNITQADAPLLRHVQSSDASHSG